MMISFGTMGGNSEKAFFDLIKVGLFPYHAERIMDSCLFTKDVDWEEIYRLAEEQAVMGLIAEGIDLYKLHDSSFKIPQEWALRFVGQTMLIEQRNRAMNAFVAELMEGLRKQGIHAILVKGQGIAQCFEKPLWRAPGDVDLLLSKDEYPKAKAFLIPLGEMTEPEEVGKKHLALNIEGWTVELHGTLHCGLSRRVDKMLDEVQEDDLGGMSSVGRSDDVCIWKNGDTDVPLLLAENNAIYVFTHILQHFFKGGIGLRQICDWCRLLWTYHGAIDLALLEKRIRKAGLLDEWRAFGEFAVKYLGMPIDAMPLYADSAKWQRKADKISVFILEVGNLGHNRDNSYYGKYPFLIRKTISFGRRLKDLMRHAKIFPMNSVRFLFGMTMSGLKAASHGE